MLPRLAVALVTLLIVEAHQVAGMDDSLARSFTASVRNGRHVLETLDGYVIHRKTLEEELKQFHLWVSWQLRTPAEGLKIEKVVEVDDRSVSVSFLVVPLDEFVLSVDGTKTPSDDEVSGLLDDAKRSFREREDVLGKVPFAEVPTPLRWASRDHVVNEVYEHCKAFVEKPASQLVLQPYDDGDYVSGALAIRLALKVYPKQLSDGTLFSFFRKTPFGIVNPDVWKMAVRGTMELLDIYEIPCSPKRLTLAGSSLSYPHPGDYDLSCVVTSDEYEYIKTTELERGEIYHFENHEKNRVEALGGLEVGKTDKYGLLTNKNSRITEEDMARLDPKHKNAVWSPEKDRLVGDYREKWKSMSMKIWAKQKKRLLRQINKGQISSGLFHKIPVGDSEPYARLVRMFGDDHIAEINEPGSVTFFTALVELRKMLKLPVDIHFSIMDEKGDEFGTPPLFNTLAGTFAFTRPDELESVPDKDLTSVLAHGSGLSYRLRDPGISCRDEAAKIAPLAGSGVCIRCGNTITTTGGENLRAYRCAESPPWLTLRGWKDNEACAERDIDVVCYTFKRRQCVCGPYKEFGLEDARTIWAVDLIE